MDLTLSTPIIKADPAWRILSGMAYGLSQPALLGGFTVKAGDDLPLPLMDAALRQLVDDQPAPAPAGTSPSQALVSRAVQWIIAVQLFCNIPVSPRFYLEPPTALDDGWLKIPVAIPCFAREASRLTINWVLAALPGVLAEGTRAEPVPAVVAESFATLITALKKSAVPGLNTFHFLRAAQEMDVPVSKLHLHTYCFGTGRHIRRLNSSVTERTPHIGVMLAQDKMATAQVLAQAGLPAPHHVQVADANQAIAAAENMGFPVVVKPADQEQGRGVAAGLRSAEGVSEAFAEALKFSKKILVEKHFEGQDYRLTVLEGRVIKVEQRVAGGVTGDGSTSVEQLVGAVQATPRFQKMLRESGRMPLSLDREATGLLAEAGLTPASIPVAGQFVKLRRKNNISSGGMQVGIALDDTHPDNASLAIRAARVLGLDFAGIDLIIPDIARSWYDTGALICEVNAQPQVGVKTTPHIYRDALAALMGEHYRVPVHLMVIAPDTAFSQAQALAVMSELDCNALSAAKGIWIDGDRLAARPDDGFHAAQIMLREPATRAGLCILTASQIIDRGLPTDRFQSIRLVGLDGTAPNGELDIGRLRGMIGPHVDDTAQWPGWQ